MSCLVRVFFFYCVLVASTLCLADELKPFSSDGCSLFPDADIITQKDWCSCCFEHDVAYWRGGNKAERKQADKKLKACVLKKTGNPVLAQLMYEGVRFGGSPYFYNWYRWGYGWSYDRKYQTLTTVEASQADELFQQYLLNANNPLCDT